MTLLATALAVLMLQAPATMRTVARGDQSFIESERQVVARSSAEWNAIWRQHVHPRPLPQVAVPRRPCGSVRIPACCCTFLLY